MSFFSFFPFFSSFFFFFFGRRKWRNPTALRHRGEAEPRVAASSGKKKMEPRAPETIQPKTTSFWVGLIFFFKSKRRRFGVTVFFF